MNIVRINVPKCLSAPLRIIAALVFGMLMTGSGNAFGFRIDPPPHYLANTGERDLTGRILTPDGQPVKGAKVFFVTFGEMYTAGGRDTLTDENGWFRFERSKLPDDNPMMGEFVVQAEGWGLTSCQFGSVADKPVEIRLNLQTEMHLKFVTENNKPASGVKIVLISFFKDNKWDAIPSGFGKELTILTGTDGTCIFPRMPRGYTIVIAIADDRFTLLEDDKHFELGQDPITNVPPITLWSTASIEGTLTYGATGKPVPKVHISASGTAGSGAAVTDASGHYILKQLTPGRYTIEVLLWDYLGRPEALENSWTTKAVVDLDIVAGNRWKDVNFTLIKGSCVTGTVRDRSTGKPIEGLRVLVCGPAHPIPSHQQYGRTDAAGRYSVRVPAGEQTLYLETRPDFTIGDADIPTKTVTVQDGHTATADFAAPTPSGLNNKPLHGRANRASKARKP